MHDPCLFIIFHALTLVLIRDQVFITVARHSVHMDSITKTSLWVMERVLVFLCLLLNTMCSQNQGYTAKIVMIQMSTDWYMCFCESACHSLSQCNNGTASVDRVVCFVEVYSELVCLHIVKL